MTVRVRVRVLGRVRVRVMVTQLGYYHGSTVVPVVVPVFWSFLSVGWKRNFPNELKGDLKWYE